MPATPNARVLLVEDTPSLAHVYLEYLKREPLTVTHADTGRKAMECLAESPPDVLLLDLMLPDMNGLDILKSIGAEGYPTATIVITANGSIQAAIDAMREGAVDFLVKPFNAERLRTTVRNAAERQRLANIVQTYSQSEPKSEFFGFIGESVAMQAVYRTITSVASSKAAVFITGESGTGKELCAEAIHKSSPRRDGPFIAINCGAIPKDLMESEIFGHVKGAFTGATADREGAASLASGGTLFLDELCEMDLSLQTKLLRFLQTGSFTKVGGSRVETVDVRIVSATNRDAWREVQEGRFREDLYYRLHVIPIHLPPLRDRDDDVVLIARRFLRAFSAEEGKRFERFSEEAEDAIRAFPWPGNVRQLQNVVRNIVVLHDGEDVGAEMMPPPLGLGSSQTRPRSAPTPAPSDSAGPTGRSATARPAIAGDIKPLWMVEKEAIEQAIAVCDGNIPKAAALLDISASTIYRKKLTWKAAGAAAD